MATMDTIQSMGGNVSVFYDIGGKSDGKSILKAIEQVSCSDVIFNNHLNTSTMMKKYK